MGVHSAEAIWHGGLKEGKGNISTESGAVNAAYSFGSRFEDDKSGTNPEELIGGALAGCFSMFLSSLLEKHGHVPKHIKTEAKVTLSKDDTGPLISKIELTTEATVENIEEADFQKHVQDAKQNCPVSRALRSIPEVTVTASLSGDE
ncbi:OsmC family protein [Adhaeribacter sp. BT258]|uniref:OsmC family protein n=1 Tax=Adhaeribacter terrigena TaxID=2793070 RepID=A0ABS1BYJ3_9BACT|nr:OsmC family protein [Adhaeribacter terrigena]MBK0401977.1 OsmC family protein [Adhaeribacter terrigena]